MKWVSENKFLVGFGAAILAGIGALGYLAFSAMSENEAAFAKLEAAREDLARVQKLSPFPSEPTLKQIVTEKQALADKLSAVQQDFKNRVLPVEPVRKEAFQDRLKDTVAAVSASAAETKVILPEKFYLDYTEYRDKPPEEPAAPLLARQLRAIKLVMDLLVHEGRLEVKDLKREPFSEEKPAARAAAPAPGKPPTGAAAKPDKKLVEKTSFTIKFLSSDDALRKILNGIVGNKHQIFIIRKVAVQNERQTSPQKTLTTVAPPAPTLSAAPGPPAATPAGTAATPVGTPAAPAAAAAPLVNLEYAFGKERVEATIDIEVLNFAEPEKPTAKGVKTK